MFFVYGTSGRLFSGTMEQLRHVGGVDALTRTHALRPVARDGRDTVAEAAGEFTEALANAASGDEASRSALAAYAQTQKVVQERRPLTTVDSLMSREVVTLDDAASVQQAWQLLSEKALGQAPVVAANGQLIGLLTRADLLKPERLPSPDSHVLAWRAMLMQNVKDIMVTPVPSVAPDADIRRVARVLLDTGLPGLPVVDEQGSVIGFISRSDILRAVVTDPPLDLWG